MTPKLVLHAFVVLLAASGVRAETIAITNAHIYSMGPAGEIGSGTVLVRDGSIIAVGASVAVPPGARRIEAGGRVVTPGLIMVGTTLGIVALPSYGNLDDSSTSNVLVSAGYDASDSLNPALPEIAEARHEGVTAAVVTPEPVKRPRPGAMFFGGQAAVIHLTDGPDFLMKPRVGITLSAGGAGADVAGGGRGTELIVLRAILNEVRRLAQSHVASEESRYRAFGLSEIDLEALVPVVRSETPLFVRVSLAADIRRLLAFAREEHIKLVLVNAAEGWTVARAISAAHVPVVLDPDANIPQGIEDFAQTNENAARLVAAGVNVAFMAVHARPDDLVRSPRVTVGRLVGQAGLAYHDALEALTLGAARIAGIADQTGSLEPGKSADLVLWEGDPLEASSRPAAIFIRGQEQSLMTRERLLGLRYLARYRESKVIPVTEPGK